MAGQVDTDGLGHVGAHQRGPRTIWLDETRASADGGWDGVVARDFGGTLVDERHGRAAKDLFFEVETLGLVLGPVAIQVRRRLCIQAGESRVACAIWYPRSAAAARVGLGFGSQTVNWTEARATSNMMQIISSSSGGSLPDAEWKWCKVEVGIEG